MSGAVLNKNLGFGEVSKFVDVYAVVIVDVECNVGNIVRWCLIDIVGGGINGLFMLPFNNKSNGLNEGLTFVFCNGLDACNGGVGHWDFGPVMLREFMAGGQQKKEIISLCIADGGERNGTKSTQVHCV